ncbi:MAG: hypothetical protein RLZZ352_1689 [Pseudomonadota bacterium]|jgi:transposase
MPIPKPPYPAAFRQQMVELVQAGRKPSELAQEFGCHVTSILAWVRRAGVIIPATTQGSANAALNAAERQELIELRRKFRQVHIRSAEVCGPCRDVKALFHCCDAN